MSRDIRILLFTEDENETKKITMSLKKAGDDLKFSYVHNVNDFLRALKEEKFDFLILDFHIEGVIPDGVLAKLEESGTLTPIIAVVKGSDIHTVMQLAKRGYHNYIIKENYDELLRVGYFGIELDRLRHMGAFTCKDLFLTLFSVTDGVINTNKEGRVVFINAAAQHISGWGGITAIGRPLHEVLHLIDEKTRERISNPGTMNNVEIKEQCFDYNPILVTKTGAEKYISIQRVPLYRGEGELTGHVITFQDFSNYRQIAERLKIERNNLRNQFQYAPVGMAVVDKNFRIRSANDRFIDICDGSGEIVIGNDLCKSLGCINSLDESGERNNKCDNCLITKCIAQTKISGIPLRDIEKSYNLIRDGRKELRIFSCNYVPLNVEDEVNVLLSVHDITEQRAMEERLIKSRDFYLTLFEEFPTMVWRCDLTRGVDYVNKKFLEFTGRKPEQELGTRWIDNLHVDDVTGYIEAYNNAFDKEGVFTYEYRMKRHDGKYRWFLCHGSPYYDMDRKFAGYIGTNYDITQKKKQELETNRAIEATKEAYRAKSEFLANMSHEIRTPLNGILGMIDLTLRTALTKEQADNLNIAKNCANSLLTVINDVLDFSKMEMGKISIENVEFNIKDLINRIIRIHHIKASEKGVELSYQMPADLPDKISGDPDRLQQVLNNIISNAIKFTDEGFANLIIRTVTKDESHITLRFSMRDSGIGISDEEMKKLFRSFSQVDGSRTRRHGGAGLGLVISRNIIEMMGGTLEVKSEKGQGSTFSFTLNFEMCRDNNSFDSPIEEKSIKGVTGAKILLVEDDEINQKVISKMLREMGYKYDVAGCGEDALDLLEENNYDLCLMDIQMPVLDGVQTASIIRENEIKKGRSHMPIIAITAYALQGDRERFLAMGMDEYIAKPFQITELHALLEKLLINKKLIPEETTLKVERLSSYLQNYMERIQPILYKMENNIENLRVAIENGDMETTEERAHEIKNIASTVSIDRLKTLSFRIELAARRGDAEKAEGLYSELENEFKKYIKKSGKTEEEK